MTALGSSVFGAEKRRTTRVAKNVAITVSGIDALQQPFIIATRTLAVSCHGCRYKSKHYIPKHSIVTIEISGADYPSRLVSGRVVWVQRPRTVNQEFEIGLEFDTPQNAWGVVEPLPEDWLPFCNHQTAAAPALMSHHVEARNGQLHKTIERAIYRSIERTAESVTRAALQEIPARLAPAIAKKVCEEISRELEMVVQAAVREAVKGSAIEVSKVPE
jgi:hypothetical protein